MRQSDETQELSLIFPISSYPVTTIQDWSNKHLFTSSLDYWNQEQCSIEGNIVENRIYGTMEDTPKDCTISSDDICLANDVASVDPHVNKLIEQRIEILTQFTYTSFIDKPAWMMLVSAVLLACAFLDSLVVVSQLSFANAISHLAINVIIMIYCISQINNWSLSSPKEFKRMLKWSHVAAAFFKAIFGLCGFLTFGELTQVLVNIVLVIKALLSYPLPFYAAVQLLKDNLFRGIANTPFTGCYSPDGSLREWALFLRIVLLLFTLFIALSVPYLIELMGLIGNITGTMLSFIWPALFHLHIKGKKMVDRDKKFDQFIIGMGCTICISGVYFSLMELIRAVQENER
uniref:Aa_trans domain-containing protein n=1 Tax=Heterorhabditis bacteriophora TaxID=37862 RepID=A0A1I7X805_HETBA